MDLYIVRYSLMGQTFKVYIEALSGYDAMMKVKSKLVSNGAKMASFKLLSISA